MVIHPTTRDETQLCFGHVRHNIGIFSGVLQGRTIRRRFVNRPSFASIGLNGDRVKLTKDAWCDVSMKVSVRTLPVGAVGKGGKDPFLSKRRKDLRFFSFRSICAMIWRLNMNSECKKVCNFVTPTSLQPVFEKMGKELSGPLR